VVAAFDVDHTLTRRDCLRPFLELLGGRRGIAAALTSVLVAEALERGIQTVFLSAGDETIARVYGQVGFERVGTAWWACWFGR
jgi:phosphoserine phosphatase